ncbi:MAG: Fpg/Nei family DNA glycosylase [Sandaracinus sp.]|nr:Fpg/Nei family DNA glycosylase [Sandaracinus sp.]
MPEGDTIFRAAARLRPVLEGERVVRWEATLPALAREREGRVVTEIEARGKNLLFAFDDGLWLHSHLLMNGRWDTYAPDQRWRLPRTRMSVAIHTARGVAVGFDLPVARFVRRPEHARQVATLGPDLLSDAPLAHVLPRLRACAELPLGAALMRQHVVAGIGNVYKSEVLYVERVDPFAKVASFDDATLLRVLERARQLLARNVGRGPRVTRRGEGGRHWVYGRSGDPCFTCGDPVRMRRQGDDGRSTYFCSTCQRTSV